MHRSDGAMPGMLTLHAVNTVNVLSQGRHQRMLQIESSRIGRWVQGAESSRGAESAVLGVPKRGAQAHSRKLPEVHP